MFTLSSPRLFLTAGACAVALAGCVTYVVPLTVVPSVALDDTCAVPAGRAVVPLATGKLDVGLTAGYEMHPRFENHGSSEIIVTGVDVELHEGATDGPLLALTRSSAATFELAVQRTVPAATSDGPGVVTTALRVVAPEVGAELRARVCRALPYVDGCNRPEVRSADERVVAVLRFRGSYPDGPTWTSEGIPFPIDVSCGGLLVYPPEADSPEIAGPDCTAGALPGRLPCSPGADEPVDCRACSGSNPLCEPRNCASR